MRRGAQRGVGWFLLALLVTGCGGAGGGRTDSGPEADGGFRFPEVLPDRRGPGDQADTVPDLPPDAVHDGSAADLGGPDGTDASPLDHGSSDAAPPDAASEDATSPDVSPSDLSFGDAGDATVPDIALPDASLGSAVHRVVLAGDSWSGSAIQPLIDALPEWGFPGVTVSWELTAIGGSTAAQWASNEGNKLDALTIALLQDPPAEILLLFLGGNDLNGEIADGFCDHLGFVQEWILDGIREDLRTVVEFALEVRPGLRIVLVDYDYLHLPFLQLYLPFDGVEVEEFNLAFVALGERKREIAAETPGCYYAHDFGILQHTLGDHVTPPFFLPLFDYPPGLAPKPGFAPDYLPFPGGVPALPSPFAAYPDGIHPEPGAMRIILDNVFEQGLDNLLLGTPWVL